MLANFTRQVNSYVQMGLLGRLAVVAWEGRGLWARPAPAACTTALAGKLWKTCSRNSRFAAYRTLVVDRFHIFGRQMVKRKILRQALLRPVTSSLSGKEYSENSFKNSAAATTNIV